MNITRTTEPATEPVTLDEAKDHLRIVDFTGDDALIGTAIATARRMVEDMTGRALIDTVFTQSVRHWASWIELYRCPAASIQSVKYDDADGNEQTVTAAEYHLRPYGDGAAEVVFLEAFEEPDLLDEPRIDRIRIQFTAGYGAAAANVPHTLRQAVLYLVQHLYDNRSPVGINVNVSKLPFAVEALCGPYKIYQL